MDDSANTSEPQQLSEASIRRLLTAVHQALDVAVPARGLSRVACLMLLEHRARIARAGVGRLIRRFPAALAVSAAASGDLAGPVTYQRAPPGAVRRGVARRGAAPAVVNGRDGLPVQSADGRQVHFWASNNRGLESVGRQVQASQADAARAQLAADRAQSCPPARSATRTRPHRPPGDRIIMLAAQPGRRAPHGAADAASTLSGGHTIPTGGGSQ